MADTKEKTNNTQKIPEPKKPWGMPSDIAAKYEDKSLVANQFGDKKEKTWNDVKKENGNDPAKMAEWLNNNPSYKAGNLTKKGMEEFGYSLDENGKWAANTTSTSGNGSDGSDLTFTGLTFSDGKFSAPKTNATTNDALNGLEGITKEDPKTKWFVNGVTNKDGSVNEQKTYDAMSQYEQKLVEMGAGYFDKDHKFVLKDTTKKGWEDLATMLSVGASVIGLAMGVPIVPINFRNITNKDEKDAKIREFQKQYTDIMAGNAAKVKDVESSAEAGKLAKANEDDIKTYSKYKEDIDAYEAKSNIDTDSEKKLIETRTEAQIKADQAKFENDMKRLDKDNTFKLNYQYLQNEYGKDFAKLQDALTTNSAKELLDYKNTKMMKDIQNMINEKQIDLTDIAMYRASQNGIRPSDVTFNRVIQGVETGTKVISSLGDTAANIVNSGANFIDSTKPF